MNERIKELAKQAAVEHHKTLPPATHTTPLYLVDKLAQSAKDSGIEIISDGFCEKFADLIVKECMNVLHDNELWNRHISHVLKEHFGVEE